MRRQLILVAATLLLVFGVAGIAIATRTQPAAVESHPRTGPDQVMLPGESHTHRCTDGSRPGTHLHTDDQGIRRDVFCAEPVNPTATPEPTATNTPVPPTPTNTPQPITGGWHAPGTHDAIANNHEHGDAPPQWVLNSPNQPFTQTRESHTGYKGAYAVSPGGVESYFIDHVLSTEGARSHGDHDYQLWLRDPETGFVHFEEGFLCYADPCLGPTREMTVDDGQRPIVLGERSATDGCETWYSDPGHRILDTGFTVCQRYQAFDGTILGGDGSFRTIDWIIPCDRLPAGSPFLDNCRVEFTVNRLSFIVNSREYENTGVNVTPIN